MTNTPEFSMSHLALRTLTEREFNRVLSCPEGDLVCEWPNAGLTFVYCRRGVEVTHNSIGFTGDGTFDAPVIYRAGALGGDVKQMDGGWVYLDPMHAMSEWREIQHVAPAYGGKALG